MVGHLEETSIMTQKEKQLFLKDLCARLPYGTIYNDIHGDSIVTYIDLEKAWVYLPDFDECRSIDDIKPYLRPMSSMTKKEKRDLGGDIHTYYTIREIDWLNAHHFDYRGLIKKGLALEAPEGMYKTE